MKEGGESKQQQKPTTALLVNQPTALNLKPTERTILENIHKGHVRSQN